MLVNVALTGRSWRVGVTKPADGSGGPVLTVKFWALFFFTENDSDGMTFFPLLVFVVREVGAGAGADAVREDELELEPTDPLP
jgi:hypothetical protein